MPSADDDAQSLAAFNAVEEHLKTLGLWEFPCGTGKWRELEPIQKVPLKKLKNKKPIKTLDQNCDTDSIKLQAEKEKVESLQELVISPFSPWHADCSWSNEATKLREMAVKTPAVLSRDVVFSYFKTIRICDYNITEIDEKMLQLKNLEELTLTANRIHHVDSKHLPPTLKVLELFANDITDLSQLCLKPPLLEHLGLGNNNISVLGSCLSATHWPQLVSLDLSNNNLLGFEETITNLAQLPRLKTLLLVGNPLSFVPAYRGFTIDFMSSLSVLDDTHISVDERLQLKGLKKMKEYIEEIARIQIGVKHIQGIPCPDEIKHKDIMPEFPVVERKYFLQFMIPVGDPTLPLFVGSENWTEANSLTSVAQATSEPQSMGPSLPSSGYLTETRNTVTDSSQSDGRPSDDVSGVESSVVSSVVASPDKSGPVTADVTAEDENANASCSSSSTLRTSSTESMFPLKTKPMSWAQELDLHWVAELYRNDLITMKRFFKKGMDFMLMEQIILGYPADQIDGEEKVSKGKKDKDVKKKKDVEIVQSETTVNTIATFHAPLECFLEGEYEYSNVFTENISCSSPLSQLDDDKNSLKKKEKKKDDIPDPKDKNKNAKAAAMKDEKKKKQSLALESEDGAAAAPLEIKISVKLFHWTSATDPINDEKKKNDLLRKKEQSDLA
ncbi:leucine-rich repeat-containing protein 43-like isoform X2 [Physella acuta]|uniref:leucine-rich repeat-containing protein 43-like isoform X2 n=1 Tax=Physella acuta TaxID=109671 RepID=UPI0027DC9DFE|nr:leucine-rich repeat-containing protein 43-like isoform X2 [Physella acuta]